MSQESATAPVAPASLVAPVQIYDMEFNKNKFDVFIDKKYKNSSKNSKIMFREEGEKYLRFLEHKDKNLTSKEKFRIKQRKFCVKHDSQNIGRLAQCTEVKDGGKSEMKILPIVYADEFFSTIHKVHIDVSGHCGINKT